MKPTGFLFLLIVPLTMISKGFSQPRLELLSTYDFGGQEEFWDIYRLPNGGFAVCGLRLQDHNEALVMRTNPQNGNPIWLTYPFDRNVGSKLVSIIEADNGDLVAGGQQNGRFVAVRLNSEGEVVWVRDYGEGFCNAVIELKEGDFMLAGNHVDRLGLLVRIDGEEGEPIWSRTYSPGYSGYFRTMRETDGEVVVGGFGRAERQQFLDRAWAIKADTEEGDVIWTQYYDDIPAVFDAMVSTGNNGFALTGEIMDADQGRQNIYIFSVDQNGNPNWINVIDRELDYYSYGIARLYDGGFAYGGWRIRPNTPFVIRTDPNGQIRWEAEYDFEEFEGLGEGKFLNLITGHNSEIVACGWVQNGINGTHDGLIMRLEPEILHIQYLIHSPEDTVFTVLPDTTIEFFVAPRNIPWDALDYEWTYRNNIVSEDTLCSIEFTDLGEELVRCQVTQDDIQISITWHVTVTDLYVSQYSPDSLNLTLRRGQSVDFSLDTVRAVEGDPLQYLWRKSNDFGEVEDAGTESRATVAFMQSGHYSVEGLAYRGESSDVVTWSVNVHGVVWSFAPEDLALEVLPDSLVRFEVIPTNPEDTTLSARWFVDDDPVLADILSLDWLFSYPVHSVHNVLCVLADSVESDTVLWTVTIRELGVDDGQDARPTRDELLTVSPNPFNSMLTIKYQSVESAKSAVNIYDISGREVARLVETQAVNPQGLTADDEGVNPGGMTPFRKITWNAANAPAGVYFVRLNAGGEIITKKVVLIR